jgi:formate-dependent nitrite reductase membrane component NrfD
MSLGQDAYNTTLAYGKFNNYKNVATYTVVGIILIIVSICLFITNPTIPVTNNTPTTTDTNSPSQQNPTPTTFPWYIKVLFLFVGVGCFVAAYYFYSLVTNKSLESVVATQGALDLGSDVSTGIGKIFKKGGYYYFT